MDNPVIFDQHKFAIGSVSYDAEIARLDLYDRRTVGRAVGLLEDQSQHPFAWVGSACKLNQHSVALVGRERENVNFVYHIYIRKGAILGEK
jgi:hypothetical protein